MSLKTKIFNYLEQHTGWAIHRQETVPLLGKPHRVIQGTIRKDVDYDDAWRLALAQDVRIAFDVGSNIGQSAVLMMQSRRIERIILIDPNPTALSQAAENLILNGWSDKASFVCAFVSDQPNEVKQFFTVGTDTAGDTYTSQTELSGASFNVPAVTVDSLAEKYQIVPDFVKIDVEGAEITVLHGAVKLAQKGQTRFFIEMHSGKMTMSENARQVLDWCNQYHYRAWYLKEKTQMTDPAQIAARGRCHLLLLPEDTEFPPYLLNLTQGDSLEKVHIP
jgi:FkbM family methyltransferase